MHCQLSSMRTILTSQIRGENLNLSIVFKLLGAFSLVFDTVIANDETIATPVATEYSPDANGR